jgi:hypothetical protein
MATKRKQLTAAGARFEHHRGEALRRLKLITEAVTSAGRGADVNWADVGSMVEVENLLSHVGHHAGVPEFTEK